LCSQSFTRLQGIEVYNGIPIIYGCGDFVDDYAVDSAYRNNLGPATHTHTRHVCVPNDATRTAVHGYHGMQGSCIACGGTS
jgi:hypothetical protein